jgi:hypothetical protein
MVVKCRLLPPTGPSAATLDRVVAIGFTEKAAGELKLPIRFVDLLAVRQAMPKVPPPQTGIVRNRLTTTNAAAFPHPPLIGYSLPTFWPGPSPAAPQ